MSTGKANKFQNSVIKILTEYDAASPGTAVTGVTQATEAVVTATSHGLGANGSYGVAKFEDVVGMTELNGSVYPFVVVDANSVRLVGIDSTGFGAYVSGGIIRGGTFTRWCELTGFNRQGGQAPEIDTTDVCATAATSIRGLKDNGSIQIDFKYLPDEALQAALLAFDDSGDYLAIRYAAPGSAVERIAIGYITNLSETGQVGSLWTASMSFRVTGPILQVAL